MVLDPAADFVELTVSNPYGAADTQIAIDTLDEHFDSLPNPTTAGQYNLLWYDDTNYEGRPQDDPNREWVRVTAINYGSYIITCVRGTAGTSASTKNTSGATYKMLLAIGSKFRDDLETSMIDVGVKYSWITEYGGVGDGSTDDKAAFDAAIAASVTHLVVPEGTWKIGASLAIPSTMTLELKQGAILAPITATTLTLNGPVIAGNYAITGGAGTVTLTAIQPVRYSRWTGGTQDLMVLGTHTPSSAGDTGTAGSICWDTGFIYVCTATDTWERVAIASW
jgi:hypothetical protein